MPPLPRWLVVTVLGLVAIYLLLLVLVLLGANVAVFA